MWLANQGHRPELLEAAAPAEPAGATDAAPRATPSAIRATRLRLERRRLVGAPEIFEPRVIVPSPHCGVRHSGRTTGVWAP